MANNGRNGRNGKKTGKELKTTFHTVAEIINRKIETPIDLAVIPNYMGINLCSVEAMTWTKPPDGQLVSLTIHFLPHGE